MYWTQVTNNMQAGPNVMQEILPGWRNPETFVIVSDVYPTVSAQAADLILPSAMWVEKEGAYGNAERRTQFWHQLVTAPGEARSDLWQLVEFSKRFRVDEVWPAELLSKAPEFKDKTLFDVLFKNGQVDRFSNDEIAEGYANHEAEAFGFYLQKGLFEEYAGFGRGHAHDLAAFDVYHRERGLRWPVVNEKETSGATARVTTPMSKPAAVCSSMAMRTRRRSSSRFPMRCPPRCRMKSIRSG